MAEYHIPKLARHEVANPDGEILTVRLVDMTGAKKALDVDP